MVAVAGARPGRLWAGRQAGVLLGILLVRRVRLQPTKAPGCWLWPPQSLQSNRNNGQATATLGPHSSGGTTRASPTLAHLALPSTFHTTESQA